MPKAEVLKHGSGHVVIVTNDDGGELAYLYVKDGKLHPDSRLCNADKQPNPLV